MPWQKQIVNKFKFLIIFFILGIPLATSWFYYLAHAAYALPYKPYEFSVEPGSSLKKIAVKLAEEKVIPSAWLFLLLSRITEQETAIKAGDYLLNSDISPLRLLEYLVKGDSQRNEIRFIEGWTFAQIRETLNNHSGIKHDTLHLSEAEIAALLGANQKNLEGLLFPDTYFFMKNSSDLSIIKRSYDKMQNHLQVAWSLKKESLPIKNEYEGLILASIIEKETGKDSDRELIAAVFINRLRLGMKLQTDPTVIYGLGDKFDGNLRKQDLVTDHAYNTYTRLGLPPTPIAMPGLASIQAALNPAENNLLYFVAKGNGESHFSKNLKEHNMAVQKYQKR
ncbi:MAG: endolytic transglycosylase MltG [Nitrosomonas sp.]|nr:endolytic transglycosylase MltG [Nitrosomonas sp.]